MSSFVIIRTWCKSAAFNFKGCHPRDTRGERSDERRNLILHDMNYSKKLPLFIKRGTMLCDGVETLSRNILFFSPFISLRMAGKNEIFCVVALNLNFALFQLFPFY